MKTRARFMKGSIEYGQAYQDVEEAVRALRYLYQTWGFEPVGVWEDEEQVIFPEDILIEEEGS